MKHESLFKIVLAYICLAITVAFVGCSDVTKSGYVSDGSESNICKVGIDVNVKDSEGNVSKLYESNSSRTILPIPQSWNDETLYFKLEGSSNLGDLYTDEIEFDEDNNHTVNLTYAIWELTLTAYKTKTGDVLSDPVLKGNLFADLVNGPSGPLEFILEKHDLTTLGGFSLTGTYLDSSEPTIFDHAIGILTDFYSDAVIDDEIEVVAEGTALSLSKTDLDPGTYYIKVNAYNEDGTVIGVWGDEIVIDPGLTTYNSVNEFNGNKPFVIKINTPPTAPASLKVWLVDDDSLKVNDTYVVKLEWEDSSSSEEYFDIRISEYTENSVRKDGYYWNSDENEESELSDISSIIKKGSVLAGKEFVYLTLPCGRLFDFEIAAVNQIGPSEYTARSTSTDTTNVDTLNSEFNGKALKGYQVDDTDYRVNLVRIKYDLQGGIYNYQEAGVGKRKAGSILEYVVYTNQDIPFMAIEKYEEGYPYILSDKGNDFTGWFNKAWDAESASAAVEVEYVSDLIAVEDARKPYNNVTVYAHFDATVVVHYTIPGYNDLEDEKVTALYSEIIDNWSSSNDIKNDVLDLKTTSNGTAYIRFAIDESVADDYVEFKVMIDGRTWYSGTDKEFIIATQRLQSASYNVSVCVEDSSGIWYSNTFAITIAR